MAIALPPLPYSYTALEPYMSEATLRFHHDGHQARYVKNVNEMVRGSSLAGATLAEIVDASEAGRAADDRSAAAPFVRRGGARWERLFQQASQAWTHSLFWHSMRPDGGERPHGQLAGYDLESLREAFREEAMGLFGSGWVWLYATDDGLTVAALPDAEQPDGDPLLVCDVWEHAYYLDYPDAKRKFIDTWLDRLVNWDFANRMLSGNVPRELR